MLEITELEAVRLGTKHAEVIGEKESWHGPLLLEEVETEYGPMIAAGDADGLAALLPLQDGGVPALEALSRRWPQAVPMTASGTLLQHLQGEAVPLYLIGTPFQRRVWRTLATIPAGETTSYIALAVRIGQPQAVRAVGTAVGRNPLAVLIPCHRVLRRDGGLGGFRWGLAMKRTLLAAEGIAS